MTIHTELLQTRVSSDIKEYVETEAAKEGLSVSAWLRRLLIQAVHKKQQQRRV